MFKRIKELISQIHSENDIQRTQTIYLLQEALHNIDTLDYVLLLNKEEQIEYYKELQECINIIENLELFDLHDYPEILQILEYYK